MKNMIGSCSLFAVILALVFAGQAAKAENADAHFIGGNRAILVGASWAFHHDCGRAWDWYCHWETQTWHPLKTYVARWGGSSHSYVVKVWYRELHISYAKHRTCATTMRVEHLSVPWHIKDCA